MLKILRKVLTVNRNYGQYNHLRSYARLLKPDIESMHATVVYSFVEYVGASGSSLSWNNQHTLILLFAKRLFYTSVFSIDPQKSVYCIVSTRRTRPNIPHHIIYLCAQQRPLESDFFVFKWLCLVNEVQKQTYPSNINDHGVISIGMKRINRKGWKLFFSSYLTV